MDDNSNNDSLPKNDGLYDPYDYFDAKMYLAEALGPVDGLIPNLCLVDYGDENQASHMITELWTQDQDFSVSAAIELNQVPTILMASSGVLSKNGSFSDTGGRDTQEPTSHVVSPSDSWFSSALFAFLDSVPSSPAIAAESPLISKALQRVSSFRTGQTPGAVVVPNAATGNSSINGRRQGWIQMMLQPVLVISWKLYIGTPPTLMNGEGDYGDKVKVKCSRRSGTDCCSSSEEESYSEKHQGTSKMFWEDSINDGRYYLMGKHFSFTLDSFCK